MPVKRKEMLAPSQKNILKCLKKEGLDITWNEYKDIKDHFKNYGLDIDIKPKYKDQQFWAWNCASNIIFKCSIAKAIKDYLFSPSSLYLKFNTTKMEIRILDAVRLND
jgi:hypothetical protein